MFLKSKDYGFLTLCDTTDTVTNTYKVSNINDAELNKWIHMWVTYVQKLKCYKLKLYWMIDDILWHTVSWNCDPFHCFQAFETPYEMACPSFKKMQNQTWWLMLVILPTWKTVFERIGAQARLGKKVVRPHLSQQNSWACWCAPVIPATW
jgi:hypothetical protein